MAFLGAKCSACGGQSEQCRSCKGSGLYMKAPQMERRAGGPRPTAKFDIHSVVCHYCHKVGHMKRDCPCFAAEIKEREAVRAKREGARANRTLSALEELEARKIDRILRDIECIRAKVASGAKVESTQLQKIQRQIEMEQQPVMQKISNGWKRDLRPQSELIQAITLTEGEEVHARSFERKICKLTERQAKLRSAIKGATEEHAQLKKIQRQTEKEQLPVMQKISKGGWKTLTAEEAEHARRFERKICNLTERQAKLRSANKEDEVQLEVLDKNIQLLKNKDVLQKIAAGFRRCALEGDVAATAAPSMHSPLVESKVLPETAPTASQALERPTEAKTEQETKRDIDEVSEVSTVDTIDARQAAALEQAAHVLKAAGISGLTAEQLRAFAAQATPS